MPIMGESHGELGRDFKATFFETPGHLFQPVMDVMISYGMPCLH